MYPKPSSSSPAPLSCAPRWCSCAYIATPTPDDNTPFRAQFRYEFSLLKRSTCNHYDITIHVVKNIPQGMPTHRVKTPSPASCGTSLGGCCARAYGRTLRALPQP